MCLGISYYRWSHPSQSEGDSRHRQTEAARKFAAYHKLTLVEDSYIDPGLSARHSANADFGKLGVFLDDVETEKIAKGTVLIVEQLDRLSRDDLDVALSLFAKILRAGIKIGHVRKNRILTVADLKGFGVIEFAIELLLASEESNKKSERVQAAMDANKENAKPKTDEKGKVIAPGTIWTTKGPAWLHCEKTMVGDKVVARKWVVLANEVKKIILIFKWCIGGMGVEAICKRLVKEGIPPMPKSRRWTRNYILALLRKRVVS